MNIQELVQTKQCTVVDVRSPEEFQGGHVAESINIPLQDIPNQIEVLKNAKKPLILCCASGNRSGQAQKFLTAQGLECYNGGSWMDIN
jgi:rhodanese-related sulfurtransferase